MGLQEFSQSSAEASNTVAVFSSADDVRQQFVRLREQKAIDCLGKEIGDRVAKNSLDQDVKVHGYEFRRPIHAYLGEERRLPSR